jgi:hypothetical protein
MTRVKTLARRLGTVAPRLKQTMSADSWRTSNQSSTARGYGYQWQQARAAYLEKHPFCAFCLRDMGISYDQDAQTIGEQVDAAGHDLPFASVVDHSEAHNGNMDIFWDSSKWQSLCKPHHDSEAQARDKERNRP